MRSIVVDSSSRSRLVLREVREAAPLPNQAVVRVHSTSLNQGELRYAMTTAPDGTRPGWVFAGVVERAPLVGPGPAAGTRVVGYSGGGAWAQTICMSPSHMAELPDGISTAVASTLPIAGLTALWCLQESVLLAGRRVLIRDASGGVGHMAVQIAAASGAYVVGAVRKDPQRAQGRAFIPLWIVRLRSNSVRCFSGTARSLVDSNCSQTLGSPGFFSFLATSSR